MMIAPTTAPEMLPIPPRTTMMITVNVVAK